MVRTDRQRFTDSLGSQVRKSAEAEAFAEDDENQNPRHRGMVDRGIAAGETVYKAEEPAEDVPQVSPEDLAEILEGGEGISPEEREILSDMKSMISQLHKGGDLTDEERGVISNIEKLIAEIEGQEVNSEAREAAVVKAARPFVKLMDTVTEQDRAVRSLSKSMNVPFPRAAGYELPRSGADLVAKARLLEKASSELRGLAEAVEMTVRHTQRNTDQIFRLSKSRVERSAPTFTTSTFYEADVLAKIEKSRSPSDGSHVGSREMARELFRQMHV